MAYFDSFADFLQMGTHGPFVWSVYGIAWLTMVGVGLGVRAQKHRVLSEIRKMRKRGQV
ncbi:MAG: heme exporter protein CcmD [Natronospirillum sp.]